MPQWLLHGFFEAVGHLPQRCKKLSGEGFKDLQHSLLEVLSSAEC